MGEQLADWQAAISFARSLPGVDPTRLASWGCSLSGGHVLSVAARDLDLAATITQTPNADASLAAHGPLREELRAWLARARAAGLDAESIEALFVTTFRTLTEEAT
jgi:dienelactone hydrolase